MNIVILCGGVGTRLWPLGRKHSPKQFFPILSNKPLVRETYDRFVKVYGKSSIFFSVTKDLLPSLKEIFQNIPDRQFIVEPDRRDTAPAIGYVASVLSLRAPHEPVVFLPSDHFIGNEKLFLQCFKIGEELVRKTGKLVDIGIKALFPSTVLGYTKIGSVYSKKGKVWVYNFLGHTEKPDIDTAAKYLAQGNYLWHGSYYMWTPEKFLEAIAKYQPKMYETLTEMKKAMLAKKKTAIVGLYNKLEKISFDYAVTERLDPKDVLIIQGEFGWSDIGAWDVLYEQFKKQADKNGNVIKGESITMETKNSLIFGQPKKIVATIGLENIIIVDTPDALLVCSKSKAQEVKKILIELEKKGKKKLL